MLAVRGWKEGARGWAIEDHVGRIGPRTSSAKLCEKRWEVLPVVEQYMAGHMEETIIPGQHEETTECDGITDSELLRCLRAQDAAAFITLYERFNRQVFRFLVHMTGSLHESEELLQAIFTTVWEGMTTGMFERFDPGRGTLEGYLLGIARNAARKLIAKRARTISVEQFESSHGTLELSATEAGIAVVEQRLEIQRLREAIVQLPIEYREAITLCCLQDLSYEHAATVMNCSVGTVGSRVSRGKTLLRKALSVPFNTPQMTSVAEAR
jgi:RNA polymerase sigma-70 factor (ECF subfamily)